MSIGRTRIVGDDVVDTWRRRVADDSGDVISGWLVQLLIVIGVLSFVAYEAMTVVMTQIGLDDTAREVARAARDEYRVNGSADVATATAVEVASPRGARVGEVTEDGDDLIVELGRDTPTRFIHRIGPLESLTKVTTSARIAWAQ